MTDGNDNRRNDIRLPSHTTVFVEIRAAGTDGSPALMVAGTGVDCSLNGLQVRLEQPLLPGSRLRVGAPRGDGLPPLRLIGEVRWLREHSENWSVGFALLDIAGTDMAEWRQLVGSRVPA